MESGIKVFAELTITDILKEGGKVAVHMVTGAKVAKRFCLKHLQL
jgi:hypothetical protein